LSEVEETAEKLITISLSRAKPAPRYRRTDRIVNVLKEKVAHYMKVEEDEVKISQKLNEQLWTQGKRSRLPRISVKVTTDADGVVTVKLPNEKEEEAEKKEAEKEAKKEAKEKKEEPRVEEKPVALEEKPEKKVPSEAEESAEPKKE
jgi:ribosomal protein L31E